MIYPLNLLPVTGVLISYGVVFAYNIIKILFAVILFQLKLAFEGEE